ncbi:hypothetical protein SLS62_002527 [Diatrype stigma]|uniref:Uncharacterized protein n=1 Tax=Diatrype stigma TaxID=117547 RepID=A0AAN9UYE4_9PEZI
MILGGTGAFVEKTVAEIGENLLEPRQTKGDDKTIERRIIYVLHPGEPLPPVIIAAIVLSCIVLVASIVGFGLYCCSSRSQARKTKYSDAALAELAARVARDLPTTFLRHETGPSALDSVPEPVECHLQQHRQ